MNWNPFLIGPRDLSIHLGKEGLSIVDATWHMPADLRSGRAEFEEAHIPGAVFFDLDEIVDASSPLPHTLPAPDVFAKAVGELGICDKDTIVIYDTYGLYSAPRVWWMFRIFGARDVRVLDGGLPAWRDLALPLESGPAKTKTAIFDPSFNSRAVVPLPTMQALVAKGSCQIVDARSAERFSGSAPEPRKGLRSGHMPGAFNVPFTDLQENGRLKDPDGLRDAFKKAGVDPDRPVVTSCGSGITAAVVNFALQSLGNKDNRLYDGSWTEWGAGDTNPVVTGTKP